MAATRPRTYARVRFAQVPSDHRARGTQDGSGPPRFMISVAAIPKIVNPTSATASSLGISSDACDSSRISPSSRRWSLSISSTSSVVVDWLPPEFADVFVCPWLCDRFVDCHRLHGSIPPFVELEFQSAFSISYRTRTEKAQTRKTALHRLPRPPPATEQASGLARARAPPSPGRRCRSWKCRHR